MSYQARFKVWWQDLSQREQRILMLGALSLALFLPYAAVWQPLQARLQHVEDRLERQQADILWMQQSAQEIKVLRGSPPTDQPVTATPGQSLLGLIDSTARTGALAGTVRRIQPEGQNTVRAWLENVPFDDLLHWLALLQQQHGVRISGVVIDRQNEAGLVSARIALERAG